MLVEILVYANEEVFSLADGMKGMSIRWIVSMQIRARKRRDQDEPTRQVYLPVISLFFFASCNDKSIWSYCLSHLAGKNAAIA